MSHHHQQGMSLIRRRDSKGNSSVRVPKVHIAETKTATIFNHQVLDDELIEDKELNKESEANPLVSILDNPQNDERVNTNYKFHNYSPEDFARQCAWTSSAREPQNCTILARPPAKGGEGISNWIGQIVQGHIVAQQAGCRFLLDYGPEVDVTEVVSPASSSNWIVPHGFICQHGSAPCFLATDVGRADGLASVEKAAALKDKLALVPTFRHAYTLSKDYYRRVNEFRDILQILPGFDIYTAMTCSLGSLFQLSQTASNYEPSLFDHILPALHSKDSLTLSLYIRTGQAEKKPGTMEGLNLMYKKRAEEIIHCAMNQQSQWLSKNRTKPYSHIVWMVITDSQFVKKMVMESHNGTTIVTSNVVGGGTTPSYPLEVLTTRSRGAHTKTLVAPSTRDFAEALIDWYLIGESDIVVTDDFAPSFGDTATFRTTRPYHKVLKFRGQSSCHEKIPVYQWK